VVFFILRHLFSKSGNIKRSPKAGSLGIMVKLSLNLPAKRRIEIKIVKSRLTNLDTPLFPKLGEILRVRRGNKISRIFRRIFENNRIKKVLGLNLAALFLSTSLVQFPFEETTAPEEDFVTEAPFILETEKSVQYPVENINITQGYKMFHPGLDLDGITGDPIRPVMDGTVEAINYSKYAYGNAILINHGSDITTLYAHLSKILVNPNQEVTTDTIIGEMGATGHASGDHLHLEIRDSGKPINPLTVLPQ
jgi:murein DD-endopeptidase MepM/ murein hydrolase activator NlpD